MTTKLQKTTARPIHRRFEVERRRLEQTIEQTLYDDPCAVFGIVYALETHPAIRESVARLLQKTLKLDNVFGGGFIYVLRDDRDPANVVKIGMTRRTADARLREHQRDLDDVDRQHTANIVCVETIAPRTCELIAHNLLASARYHDLANVHTNRPVTEYFYIRNVERLRRFLTALARTVDANYARHLKA